MGDSGLIYMLAFTTFALVILFLIWQRMRVQRAKELPPKAPHGRWLTGRAAGRTDRRRTHMTNSRDPATSRPSRWSSCS
jgi:hypothetical protein